MRIELYVFVTVYLCQYMTSGQDDTYCRTIKFKSQSTVCCFAGGGEVGKCFPTAVIAGAQKSGTTVLAAQLALHPWVSFSQRKELHFFSRSSFYHKGAAKYLDKFNFWNTSFANKLHTDIVQHGLEMPMFAEATPFYIASRDSCRRMSATIPYVKLIIMMREPVARAYSEYQMKKRRVDTQNSFIALAHRHVRDLYSCLVLHPMQWQSIPSCVPADLSTHTHFPKLILALKAIYRNVSEGGADTYTAAGGAYGTIARLRGPWERVLRTCFDSLPERARHATPRKWDSPNNTTYAIGLDGVTQPLPPFAGGLRPLNLGLGYGQTPERRLDSSQDVSLQKFQPPSGSGYFVRLKARRDRTSRGLHFQPVRCMKKDAKEELPDLHAVFREEMSNFRECGGAQFANGSLEDLNSVVDRCMTVSPGISRQFLYRSMYAVQLYHCMKYIPREQILCLRSEDLQGSEQLQTATMHRIWRFLEVDPLENLINVPTGIQASVAERFPEFENNTGWRLKSSYDPMPPDLKSEVAIFFHRMNALLDDLLASGDRREESFNTSLWYTRP